MKRLVLLRDQSGAVLVEVSVMMTIFLVFVLGSVDLLMMFYQWNAAAKAVAVGSRLAAVSDPVAAGLNNLSAAAVGPFLPPGAAMPAFAVTCSGASATCVCRGTCTGVGGYNAAAMNAIVFGRDSESCGDATSYDRAGMCDVFPAIRPANVTITYQQTGIGYAGRPGGPVPAITVAVTDMPFQLFFLGGFLGSQAIRMPPLTTSVTAEDMSSAAPPM